MGKKSPSALFSDIGFVAASKKRGFCWLRWLCKRHRFVWGQQKKAWFLRAALAVQEASLRWGQQKKRGFCGLHRRHQLRCRQQKAWFLLAAQEISARVRG
ncbi:MAG TPA: hypothetical protein VI653_26720 [Steroidobacteraceae bacterium]